MDKKKWWFREELLQRSSREKTWIKEHGLIEKMDRHAEIVVSFGEWESNDLPDKFGATE